MNERIRELINEATCFKEGDTEGKHDIEVFDKEKFAELIIKEVHYVIVVGGVQDLDIVLEHFGVEE